MGIESESIECRQIRKEMEGRELSPHHVRNIISVAECVLDGDASQVKPIEKYEEHVYREGTKKGGDLYMQLSDPGAVAEFNALVDEFNASFERLKSDLAARRAFMSKMLGILPKYNC